MTALVSAKTIDSRPVGSRSAWTEVRLCIAQLNCVCLWTSRKKKEKKDGTMLVYRGNVYVVYILSIVKTENTYTVGSFLALRCGAHIFGAGCSPVSLYQSQRGSGFSVVTLCQFGPVF